MYAVTYTYVNAHATRSIGVTLELGELPFLTRIDTLTLV